jgi:uncharacterized protein DUF4440
MLFAKAADPQETRMETVVEKHLPTVYQEVCKSYHAIDDFRAKLLALLPFATGAGIFLLLNKDIATAEVKPFLGPIGLFGFAITLGLFAYEIYGIRKCGDLIVSGKQMEGWLHIDGLFTRRPREVLGFINEPFASGIIYPAVMAAWTFISLVFAWSQHAWWLSLVVFFVGLGLSLLYNHQLKSNGEAIALNKLNQRILQAEESGDQAYLASILRHDFTIVRASGEKQDRQMYLDAVVANKSRGRSADQSEVRFYGNCAVFICRVTTARDKDGKAAVGHFWNTRMFLRQDKGWLCVSWQVMKICDD